MLPKTNSRNGGATSGGIRSTLTVAPLPRANGTTITESSWTVPVTHNNKKKVNSHNSSTSSVGGRQHQYQFVLAQSTPPPVVDTGYTVLHFLLGKRLRDIHEQSMHEKLRWIYGFLAWSWRLGTILCAALIFPAPTSELIGYYVVMVLLVVPAIVNLFFWVNFHIAKEIMKMFHFWFMATMCSLSYISLCAVLNYDWRCLCYFWAWFGTLTAICADGLSAFQKRTIGFNIFLASACVLVLSGGISLGLLSRMNKQAILRLTAIDLHFNAIDVFINTTVTTGFFLFKLHARLLGKDYVRNPMITILLRFPLRLKPVLYCSLSSRPVLSTASSHHSPPSSPKAQSNTKTTSGSSLQNYLRTAQAPVHRVERGSAVSAVAPAAAEVITTSIAEGNEAQTQQRRASTNSCASADSTATDSVESAYRKVLLRARRLDENLISSDHTLASMTARKLCCWIRGSGATQRRVESAAEALANSDSARRWRRATVLLLMSATTALNIVFSKSEDSEIPLAAYVVFGALIAVQITLSLMDFNLRILFLVARTFDHFSIQIQMWLLSWILFDLFSWKGKAFFIALSLLSSVLIGIYVDTHVIVYEEDLEKFSPSLFPSTRYTSVEKAGSGIKQLSSATMRISVPPIMTDDNMSNHSTDLQTKISSSISLSIPNSPHSSAPPTLLSFDDSTQQGSAHHSTKSASAMSSRAARHPAKRRGFWHSRRWLYGVIIWLNIVVLQIWLWYGIKYQSFPNMTAKRIPLEDYIQISIPKYFLPSDRFINVNDTANDSRPRNDAADQNASSHASVPGSSPLTNAERDASNDYKSRSPHSLSSSTMRNGRSPPRDRTFGQLSAEDDTTGRIQAELRVENDGKNVASRDDKSSCSGDIAEQNCQTPSAEKCTTLSLRVVEEQQRDNTTETDTPTENAEVEVFNLASGLIFDNVSFCMMRLLSLIILSIRQLWRCGMRSHELSILFADGQMPYYAPNTPAMESETADNEVRESSAAIYLSPDEGERFWQRDAAVSREVNLRRQHRDGETRRIATLSAGQGAENRHKTESGLGRTDTTGQRHVLVSSGRALNISPITSAGKYVSSNAQVRVLTSPSSVPH